MQVESRAGLLISECEAAAQRLCLCGSESAANAFITCASVLVCLCAVCAPVRTVREAAAAAGVEFGAPAVCSPALTAGLLASLLPSKHTRPHPLLRPQLCIAGLTKPSERTPHAAQLLETAT